MRTIGGVCVCVLLAFAQARGEGKLSSEELLKLDRKALINAAGDIKFDPLDYSEDEMIAISSRLAETIEPVNSGTSLEDSPFRGFFAAACLGANSHQLDQLVEVYRKVAVGSFEKQFCLPGLTIAWLKREFARIGHEELKIKLKNWDGAPPDEIAGAPADLLEAWHYYKSAVAPFERLLAEKKSKDAIGVHANWKSFYKIIDGALAGQTKNVISALMEYDYDGAGCLGTDDFDDPKAAGIMISLLRERRIAEAVGAVLAYSPESTGDFGDERFPLELLRPFGLDWEKIAAGKSVSRGVASTMLAVYGDDRGAAYVNEIARWQKSKKGTAVPEAELLFDIFNAFIDAAPAAAPQRPDCRWNTAFAQVTRKASLPKKEIQADSLSLAEEMIDDSVSDGVARQAITIFGKTQHRSSIPALMALTQHPSSEIGTDAWNVLRAMGESVPLPPAGEPVKFKILLNGSILPAGRMISWRLDGPRLSAGDSAKIDGNGVLGIERKYFADPRRPVSKIIFSVLHKIVLDMRSGEKVEETESDELPEFTVEVPAPAYLDATTRVDVRAGSLELTLRNLKHLNAPIPAKAVLSITRHAEDRPLSVLPTEYTERFQLPITQARVKKQLQEGSWDIWLTIPGAEVWCRRIDVASSTVAIDVALKPASAVKVKVVGPNNEPAYVGTVFKDGAELKERWDYKTSTFPSLPCGTYVLHIPPSTGGGWSLGGRELKIGPDEISIAGRDVAFMIYGGSPATIDLGEIKLEELRP